LRINITKTKQLLVNLKTQKQLKIGNQIIESVDSFTYLDRIVTTEGGVLGGVSNRKGKTDSASVQLRPVWKKFKHFQEEQIKDFQQ
jgi:hypothetical protein